MFMFYLHAATPAPHTGGGGQAPGGRSPVAATRATTRRDVVVSR